MSLSSLEESDYSIAGNFADGALICLVVVIECKIREVHDLF